MNKIVLLLGVVFSTLLYSFGQNQYELTFESIDQVQVKQVISKLMPVFNAYPSVSDDFILFRYESEARVSKNEVEDLLKDLKLELKSFKKEENE
jgi:hypothetical protein